MNHVVAYELLASELAAYRNLSYEQVRELVGEQASRIVRGSDSVDYDLAATVQWQSEDGGGILIHALIREANWGAPHDLLEDTIVVPPLIST